MRMVTHVTAVATAPHPIVLSLIHERIPRVCFSSEGASFHVDCRLHSHDFMMSVFLKLLDHGDVSWRKVCLMGSCLHSTCV